MKRPIPYALVGVGGFGRQHLATLTELEQEGEIRLTAVCDPGIHRLADIEADLRSRGVRIYEDFDTLMAEASDLEAITIAAPIPYHLRMARACVARDLYVYLEKPPVPLLEQWDELMSADKANRIAVGFQLIEAEWSQQLKSQIRDGFFGDLQAVRVAACWPRNDFYYNRSRWAGQMTMDGEIVFDGPATNALAHLIHQVMFLASCEQVGFDEPVAIQGELYRARPMASYDTASVRGRFASGVTFSAALSHASETKLPYKIRVIGSKGWAEVSQDGTVVENHLGKILHERTGADPFKDSYRVFLNYVTGIAPRPSTLLRDVKGYLLATNGMLLSSGSIHPIDSACQHYLKEEGVYSIARINPLAQHSLETGGVFAEAEVTWAVATPEIETADFSRADGASIRPLF